MSVLSDPLSVWLIITVGMFWLCIILGLVRIRLARDGKSDEAHLFRPPLEILVPVKGSFQEHDKTLGSLLIQNYPNYHVIFIVESTEDPANEVVDDLCARYPHARKIISGMRSSCAQKNHNLVAGTAHLRADTEILVFCDSNNEAAPDWVERFTNPLRAGLAEAVTTFRAFRPEPETLGGVCQAIYAAFILVLALNKPKPWGGATGIRRETFERLRVRDAWSRTVVDDLVLGNLLDSAGIGVRLDPTDLLTSPVRNQTVTGFLDYLDRQILFPKWTNPGIWLQTLFGHLNLTVAILASVVLGVLYPAGLVSPAWGWSAYGFLCSMVGLALLLRLINPFRISLSRWLLAFVPCILLAAFIFVRSIFRKYIDWHGSRYWPGKEGVVLNADFRQGSR